MTKVAPSSESPMPMILINDQIFRSSGESSKPDTKGIHSEATGTNVPRTEGPKNFCEFNKGKDTNPRTECYHITCIHKRGHSKNSTVVAESESNLENQARLVAIPSLSTEKRAHEENYQRRLNEHSAILRNDNIEYSWIKMLLYTFGIVFLGLISTFPISLIPVHDLINCPKYWYEILYHATVNATGVCFLNCCLTAYFLNVNYTLKLQNIANIILITICMINFIIVATYFIWTSVLAYQFPIPFLGNALSCTLTFPFLNMIWLNFPKEWRQDSEFRKRMKYCTIFWVVLVLTILVCRFIIGAIIQYDLIVVFVFATFREIYLWIQIQVINNTSNADMVSAEIILKYYVYVGNTLLMCSLVANHLSDVASWVLIIIDFLINILKCARFCWIKSQNPSHLHKQIDVLQDLILCELVEFQAPLSFTLIFICTYFGPNGHLFGDILNDYWTFTATEDIHQKLYKWILYFLADFSSFIVTALCLWYSFKINVLKMLFALLHEFWLPFSVILASQLTQVN